MDANQRYTGRGRDSAAPAVVSEFQSGNHQRDALLDLVRLWEQIDKVRFQFMLTAAGPPQGLDWRQFRHLATDTGAAIWRDDLKSLMVRNSLWETGRALGPAQADRARSLLSYWQEHRDPRLDADALRWAIALGDWDAIDAQMLDDLRVQGLEDDPTVRQLLSDLPVEARRQNPLLTWAWAAATSSAAPPEKREELLMKRLISDAVALHARWREARNVDAAVTAGSIWMLAQRFMPTTPASKALDAAWRTQNEVAEYIADQRSQRHPPVTPNEVMFRAASARIALARADLRNSLAEADYAIALDPDLSTFVVRGARNLAMELMGFPSEPVERPEEPGGAPTYRVGLSAQDETSEKLSRGLAALRLLDREGCRLALAALADRPNGTPGWTGVVFIQMLEGALWGDPEATLHRSDAAVARNVVVSLEHRGSLGALLLNRGRAILLSRLGSHRSATETARSLAPEWTRAIEALTLLWAGDLPGADRAADGGLHDAATSLYDRVALLVVKGSALAMDPKSPADARTLAATTAIEACLDHELWLPFGIVPPEARRQMLALHEASGEQAPEYPPLFLERAQGLATASGPSMVGLTLTRREQVLLPLLATADTVPEIARSLQVSTNTVRKQVVTLRSKFGAASRQDLVRKARAAGLL